MSRPMRSSDISSAGVGGRDPGRATTWRTFGERRGVSPPVASRSRVSGDFGGQPAALRLAARLDLAALVAGSFQHAECFIAEPGMGTEDASSVVGMNSQLSPATSPVPSVEAPSPTRAPLVLTAFWVLVVQSFQRHWRVRQMGWVALGLLGITVGWVAAVTSSPAGWGLENRRARRFPITYREYGEQLLPPNRYQALENSLPLGYTRQIPETERPAHPIETPAPLDPLRDSFQNLLLSIPHAILSSPTFLKNWAFANYTRAAMLGAYLGFILPLFTLAYASGAIGADREARSMIWLMTRPIPRWAIYLAKFVGTLPWCLAFSCGGFVALCLAGGPLGREALGLYWPAAVAGTIAFSALFHLIGAVFRRPVVVGLVYIFFFEALVAALPGSLKLLSLTFYARSLMYNGATASGYPGGMLDVPGAVHPATAWGVLTAATVGLTGLGMWLFTRTEYRDDV